MRNGSITLYLCLALSVLLSLVAVSFYSARIAAGRVVLTSSLEQSLYSLFGEYDRDLYDRYGLMFIDGGRGSSSLQLHRLTRRAETYASYITDPSKGTISGNNLLTMDPPAAEITACTLATDGHGAAFTRQVCRAAKGIAAAKGIQTLTGGDASPLELFTSQEALADSLSADTSVSASEQEAADAITIPGDFEDPRKMAAGLRRSGILSLVLPAGSQVSSAGITENDLPSHRALQRGIGITEQTTGIFDRALLQVYADELFPSYTGSSSDAASPENLQYQIEYLICGKDSDEENLKHIVNRLIAVREASNLAFLSADPEKRAESLAAATAVCTAAAVPYLAPVAAVGIRAAWAFAESILDVRTLLAGGKVPILKNAAGWQLSIEKLPRFLTLGDTGRKTPSDGLTYNQYLDLLLLLKPERDLSSGLMDLVEYNIRRMEGRQSFRIDSCIDSLGMSLSTVCEGKRLTASGSYQYK